MIMPLVVFPADSCLGEFVQLIAIEHHGCCHLTAYFNDAFFSLVYPLE
jgi:hypothetical protein